MCVCEGCRLLICLLSLRSVWFPPGRRWLTGNWKTSARRKEVRAGKATRAGEGSEWARPASVLPNDNTPQHTTISTHPRSFPTLFYIPSFCLCFIIKALEQPRRASDPHTPAKRLALACVFVTSWVTLRTSPWGTGIRLYCQDQYYNIRSGHDSWFSFLSDSRTLSTSINPCIHPWRLMLRSNWKNSR